MISNKFLFGSIILGAGMLTACNQDENSLDNPSDSPALEIINACIAGVDNEQPTSRVALGSTAWMTNDAMGTFTFSETTGTTQYPGSILNNKLTFSTEWALATPLYLSATSGRMVAYYPYSTSISSVTALQAMDVAAGTTDYLYGVSSALSSSASAATLTMKHALSLLKFTFTNSNSPNACSLTKIEIKNAGTGTTLKTAGKLNVLTGAITGSATAAYSRTVSKTFKSTVQTEQTAMLPVNLTAANLVQFVFTIDDKTFTYDVPIVNWEAGKMYTYAFTMKGNALTLAASSATISAWGSGTGGSSTWN